MLNFFATARSARNFWRDTHFNQIWASLLEMIRGFLPRTHLESKHASIWQGSIWHPTYTRLPSPPSSHQSAPPPLPFPSLTPPSCFPRPPCFTPLPSPTLPFPLPPSSCHPAACCRLAPRSARGRGSSLGSARSAQLASARLAYRGSARRLASRPGLLAQSSCARLLLAQRSSARLGSARLGSARLGSARLAQLDLLDSVRQSTHGSVFSPASRLGGAPCRRDLRAQHKQGAAQPRFSKIWAARWGGAALSREDERCEAGEGGLPH